MTAQKTGELGGNPASSKGEIRGFASHSHERFAFGTLALAANVSAFR